MKLNFHAESQNPVSWEARLRDCQSSLADNPGSPLAWRWRAQIRVLKFLISRYGNNLAVELEHRGPRSRSNFAEVALPLNPKPPKPLSVVRRILAHIADGNRNKPSEFQPSAMVDRLKSSDWLDPEHSALARFLATDMRLWIKMPWLQRWLRGYGVLIRHFPDADKLLLYLCASLCWLFVVYCLCLLASYMSW